MSSEFLLKEYDCCFEQLRYYDSRQTELMKLLIAICTSSSIAIFAIYKIDTVVDKNFYYIFTGVCALISIASFLILLGMIQVRLYFIYVARQINSIRNHYIGKLDHSFNNQMYVNTDFGAAKFMSVQFLMLCGASLLVSSFIGSTVFGFTGIDENPNFLLGLLIGILSFISITVLSYFYLDIKSYKSADEAIHNRKSD